MVLPLACQSSKRMRTAARTLPKTTIMIKNEHQYQITKAQADKFAKAIHQIKTIASSMNPLMLKTLQKALESQLADLYDDIKKYKGSGNRV